MQIVAILLAAGASRRFGEDKLRAIYRDREIYLQALAALCAASSLAETIVVVSPGFEIPAGYCQCRFVVNPAPENGMSSSLAAGVGAASEGTAAYLIALADMPLITPDLVDIIIRHYVESGKKIVIPTCRGVNGHPVLIDAGFRTEILALRGDVGARELIQRHAQLVGRLETGDEAVLFDVDTPEDLCAKRY